VVNLCGGGQRHQQGATFAFADGHAKWYRNDSPFTSKIVYNVRTGFNDSGNNPTMNATRQVSF
jgi:prepilin-type processing-associated H-X9-DG protein